MGLPDKETIEEVAKATQEVAKFGSNLIDVANTAGGFVAKMIGGALDTGIGIWHDRLKYSRWERQVRLMRRADEFLASCQIVRPVRALPLSFAVPLLQAATLEENDDLQDMWAKLLVNGLTGENGEDVRRANIDILQSLSPFDAAILSKIYSVVTDTAFSNSVLTYELPYTVTLSSTLTRDVLAQAQEPDDEVKLALANLNRLGCISLGTTWDGNQIFKDVFQTILGRKFIEACTLVNS